MHSPVLNSYFYANNHVYSYSENNGGHTMEKQVQGKPFTNMEVSSFCGQIALILKSGISSLEGITIMLEDAASADEKDIPVSYTHLTLPTNSRV